MEIVIPYSTLFTLFCFLLGILHKTKRSNSAKSIKTLPPEPWKLPLIGNMHQIIGSLPHHALRSLAKKYGPIMHFQLGETSNVVITSAEIAKEIWKKHDLILSYRAPVLVSKYVSYGGKDIGLSPYGSYWREMRKICAVELLGEKQVQSFKFIREEEVSELVKDISTYEGSIINLSEKIFSLTNSVTARAAFGKKSGDPKAFIHIVVEIMKVVQGLSIADLFPSIKLLEVLTGMKNKLERVHREYDRILENIIKDYKEGKDRNNEAKENLLGILFKIHQNNQELQLDVDNIKAIILEIFIAGSDTSSTTVEWAMVELLKNPKVMAKAQAEVRRICKEKGRVDEIDLHQMKYLNSVIKETLRLHPPGPLLFPRENSERFVINGYEIPAKTKVMINAWAIGRDPKYWEEAEIFKPERFLDNPMDFRGTNFEYIPFGVGRRRCPGIAFAIPMMELQLASLLYHFDWKLPDGLKHEELDMTESFGIICRIKTNLSLIPICYRP